MATTATGTLASVSGAPTSSISKNNANTGSKVEQDRSKFADNFDDFLLLLTTQLQNQDPTAPLDANQFTQQIVELSQVEQALNTNSNLEKLISINQSSQLNSSVGYIGRTVEVSGKVFNLENGNAEFYYTLPEDAENTYVTITDSAGKIVGTSMGEKSAGKHAFSWNGKTSSGRQLPDGIYQAVVTAKGAEDKDIDVATSVSGKVRGVFLQDGDVHLSVGSVLVPSSDVISIRETLTITADNTDNTDNTNNNTNSN